MRGSELAMPAEGECKTDLFQRKGIRKIHHEGQWWFSVKDVVEALVETVNGNDYARQLRNRDEGLNEGWRQIVVTLPFQSPSGLQSTNFISIEGIFRLMQSVPSARAEPFKKWLARVGFERLQEIQNPELAVQRAITLYRAKGYDDGWIDARIRNKVSREILTGEWKSRGVDDIDYAILTDAISVATFGLTTKRHKEFKSLAKQSLRDNMTPIELTLTTLGEQTATEITRSTDAQGYHQNLSAAQTAGRIAGTARRDIEKATGQRVVSEKNYLTDLQRTNNARLASQFDDVMRRLLPEVSGPKN